MAQRFNPYLGGGCVGSGGGGGAAIASAVTVTTSLSGLVGGETGLSQSAHVKGSPLFSVTIEFAFDYTTTM